MMTDLKRQASGSAWFSSAWINSILRIERYTINAAADTEIFVHYGFQFWLKHYMLNAKSPDLRFFYYSLHDQSTQIFNLQKFYEYDDSTCAAFLKTFVQIPQSTIDNHPKIKDLLFDLTMKNVDEGYK